MNRSDSAASGEKPVASFSCSHTSNTAGHTYRASIMARVCEGEVRFFLVRIIATVIGAVSYTLQHLSRRKGQERSYIIRCPWAKSSAGLKHFAVNSFPSSYGRPAGQHPFRRV